MIRVKDVNVVRLMVGLTVDPPLYVSEERSRRLFEALAERFPQLVSRPIIEQERFATFLRVVRDGPSPRPVCQIAGNAVQVILEPPEPDDTNLLVPFAQSVSELTRDIFHVDRVSRVGRVQNTKYTLDTTGDAARDTLRDKLTNLTAEEVLDVQLLLTRREGPYNINLGLHTGTTAEGPDPTVLRQDVLLVSSDVNNSQMSSDVSWETAEQILSRGLKHADEEVPAFLRERLGLEIPESAE